MPRYRNLKLGEYFNTIECTVINATACTVNKLKLAAATDPRTKGLALFYYEKDMIRNMLEDDMHEVTLDC